MRGEAKDNNLGLIVDDDSYVCFIASQILKDAGMATLVANTGAEALALFRTVRPKFVLLDLHLPGMSGFELLQTMKSINPEIHAVLISSDATEANVRSVGRMGGKGFIAKPFNKPTLMRYVNACPPTMLGSFA